MSSGKLDNLVIQMGWRNPNKGFALRRAGTASTDLNDHYNFGLGHTLLGMTFVIEHYPSKAQRDEGVYNPHIEVLYPDSDTSGNVWFRYNDVKAILDSDLMNAPNLVFNPYTPLTGDPDSRFLGLDDGSAVYAADSEGQLVDNLVQYNYDQVANFGGSEKNIIMKTFDVFQSQFSPFGGKALNFPPLRTDLIPRYRSGEDHYTHCFKFSNDSDGMGVSDAMITKWKTENEANAWNFDSDTSSSLEEVVKKMKNSRYYHGTLNGLAILALVCGVPATVYMPASVTLNQEQKALKKVFLHNGGTIMTQENFLMSSQAMDFGDNI
tara:strand:- start:480 stop:1445 length:966 start_codon:yes stop_codon:yes gene_type:complete